MARFLTPLDVRLIDDTTPPRWRLLSDLVYFSDLLGVRIVPAGFETDFASVPRLPLFFWLAGDTCHKPATLHDWLYSAEGKVGRDIADLALREASEATKVSAWRRWAMWAFVRVGGAGYYQGAGECPNS